MGTLVTFLPPYPFQLKHENISDYVVSKTYTPLSITFDKYGQTVTVDISEDLSILEKNTWATAYDTESLDRMNFEESPSISGGGSKLLRANSKLGSKPANNNTNSSPWALIATLGGVIGLGYLIPYVIKYIWH